MIDNDEEDENNGRDFFLPIGEELEKIRASSNRNFVKMLQLIELGIKNWQTASAILAIAYDDSLTKKQKEQIAKSYEEKFGEFPDIEPFLELGRNKMNHSFEESFFLPYENHVKHHELDSKLVNPDPHCIICQLVEKTGSSTLKNNDNDDGGRATYGHDAA
ncbi:hypothetical protein NTE_03238 [Candidatus Nitrososphaera evergladensis SR1]|jgi:hypothetical protein|uniref:Uncharacterized protein n=1 Tax=Candidatus Nitrososphaera evergladensis SR1 TaxID=1459636 RepID=A0A075MXC0_9ARCH|nr:hypothetical protein [Candidatus Nitrososphaera evergladensis]AIF85267.1 hypothetical protein NTE_03238 [Candidatus Nitrososphaera evergladensis SR1]